MIKQLLKVTLPFLAALFWSIGIYAQTDRTVTGTVKESGGNPLPAVSISVKGTSRGTSTNAAGKYSISAKAGDVLEFRYIGYKLKQVTVTASDVINVSMESSSSTLDEIRVTGALGIIQDNKKLGYSVTTVKGDDIARTNTVNPITALQGKVAGVMVNVVSSAGVQTSPFIQIRGAKVLGGNNQPIFVIDGNVIQNNVVGGDAADGGSQLKNLNPDDYESITVLKGAAATALYGSRGLNGAIVINTKSGKAGTGLGIEFTSTYSSTNVYRSFMELQDQYGMGNYNREGNFRADGTQDLTTSNWGPAFDGSMHPALYDATKMVPYVAQPDNWKTFYQDGNYINNNLTLSGGSDKGTYRISYSNTNAKGILPNNGLKRNAVDIKLSGSLNKIFSTEVGINYANTKTSNFYNQSRYQYVNGVNLGFNTYYMPRNTDFADWYATYRNPDNSIKPTSFGRITSGFATIDKNNFTNNENSLLAYTLVKAQVTPWLDLSGRANINYQKSFQETKNYGNGANNAGGTYAVGGRYSTDYNLLFMAHAIKKFLNDDLTVDLRLLNEHYGNRLGENYSAKTDGGLKVPNQFFLSNSINALQNKYTYGISYPSAYTIGAGAVLNLNYKEYLNLEIAGRNDWISTLTYPEGVPGANNNSVFYPAVSASYAFYDHLKSSMPSWLNSGRIRASLAYTGNAGVAGPYSTGSGYAPGVSLNQDNASIPSATQINGSIKPNYNLKPQIQRSIELGTNLSFLKDLINVDFAWYKTNTFDQLLNIKGIPETGYSLLYLNAGNIQNKGLELLVNVNPIRTKDYGLDFSVNLAHNKSKIVKFYPGIKEWNLMGDYEGAQVWAYEGGDFGVLTTNPSQSFQIDPGTGYPIIKNTPRNTSATNGYDFANYQYAYQTATADAPRVNIGKIEPNLIAGINTNFRYKNFNLFAQVDGRFGGMVYSETYTYAMGQGTPLASLQFRDQAHGGEPRKDAFTGKTVYNGAVPNAVFAAGEMSLVKPGTSIAGMTFRDAYNAGLVESWYAPAYYDGGFGYNGTYDWQNGLNYNGAISKNSWIMLREITLSYQLPNDLLNKVRLRGASLSLSARNIGYLYKTLTGDQNPESIQSNDPFVPVITGGVPYSRNYSVTLRVKL